MSSLNAQLIPVQVEAEASLKSDVDVPLLQEMPQSQLSMISVKSHHQTSIILSSSVETDSVPTPSSEFIANRPAWKPHQANQPQSNSVTGMMNNVFSKGDRLTNVDINREDGSCAATGGASGTCITGPSGGRHVETPENGMTQKFGVMNGPAANDGMFKLSNRDNHFIQCLCLWSRLSREGHNKIH